MTRTRLALAATFLMSSVATPAVAQVVGNPGAPGNDYNAAQNPGAGGSGGTPDGGAGGNAGAGQAAGSTGSGPFPGMGGNAGFGAAGGGTGGTGFTGGGGGGAASGGGGGGNGAPSGGGGGGGGGANGMSSANDLIVTQGITGGYGGAGGTGSGAGGGGGGGGNGVFLTGGNVVISPGTTVLGGDGGTGGGSGLNGGGGGGGGGNGLRATAFTFLTNVGTIRGGAGGDGYANPSGSGRGNGGSGGYGLQLEAGGSVANNGAISGGTGGQPGVFGGGLGGIGIVGVGVSIDNTGGTISGGFSNHATVGATAQNYAIQLTGGKNYVGTGGTITGGINVMNDASFMPALSGSAIGTPLAVTGPLMFASTSTYNIRITPTASDSTAVTGGATLNGAKVAVSAGQGTYQIRQYTILTATTGVNGRFSTVSTNLAFLLPTLSYDANNVFLNIAPTNATAAGTPDYRTAAVTQNQRAVAGGLTNAGMAIPGGNGGKILTALNQLTVPQAQEAFDSLSGEGITAAQNVANRSAQLFTSSIFDQTTFYGSGNAANSITLTEPIRELADLPVRAAPPVFVSPNRTWRAWATGFGGVDNIHGNGAIGSAYQQNTIYGGTLGVDYQLMPNYLVGVAVGGTNGDFLVRDRATSGSSTGGHIAIYDLATFGAFYGASSSSFSYFGNKTNRFVAGFGGLGNESERSNFNSNELRTRLEFGRHFAGYGGVLTPFVALELAQLRSNGFTENAIQGAGLFRLNVSGQSQASAPAFVGLRLQRVTSIGSGITLSPTLQVAYVHEFAPYRSHIGALADLPGSTFLIDGARPARNAAQVKAGAEMAIGPRSVIFANFDGELSGVNQLYAGKGGFRYVW